MTTIPVPRIVKTMFDAFPLVKLPPLYPTVHETSSESYTIPHTNESSSSTIDSNTTLFVLSNHAPSLAIQLLLLENTSNWRGERMRVAKSVVEAHSTHPYLVIPPGNKVLDSSSLMDHFSTRLSQDDKTRTKDDGSRVAYESLLVTIEDAVVLAQYLDLLHIQVLGDWYPFLVPPTTRQTRLRRHGWTRQVGVFKDAVHALQTFIKYSHDEADAWIILQVVAYAYVLTTSTSKDQLSKMAELRRVVCECPDLMDRCNVVMKRHEKSLIL